MFALQHNQVQESVFQQFNHIEEQINPSKGKGEGLFYRVLIAVSRVINFVTTKLENRSYKKVNKILKYTLKLLEGLGDDETIPQELYEGSKKIYLLTTRSEASIPNFHPSTQLLMRDNIRLSAKIERLSRKKFYLNKGEMSDTTQAFSTLAAKNLSSSLYAH